MVGGVTNASNVNAEPPARVEAPVAAPQVEEPAPEEKPVEEISPKVSPVAKKRTASPLKSKLALASASPLRQDRDKMNQESTKMELEVEELLQEVTRLRDKKNEKFYDEHVTEHYEWSQYVDYKDKNNYCKTAKLVEKKGTNLKEQRAAVQEFGTRMTENERNIVRNNTGTI